MNRVHASTTGRLPRLLGLSLVGMIATAVAAENGVSQAPAMAQGNATAIQATGQVPPPPGPFSPQSSAGGFAPMPQGMMQPPAGQQVPASESGPGMTSGFQPQGVQTMPSPAMPPHMGQGGITREEFLRQQAEFRKRMEAEMAQRRKEIEQQHEAIRRQHEEMTRQWQSQTQSQSAPMPAPALPEPPAAPDLDAMRQEAQERFRRRQEEFEAQRKAMEARRQQLEQSLPRPMEPPQMPAMPQAGTPPAPTRHSEQPVAGQAQQPQQGGWTQPPAHGYGAPTYTPYPYAPGAWVPPVPPAPYGYPPAGYAAPYGAYGYPGYQPPAGSTGNQ